MDIANDIRTLGDGIALLKGDRTNGARVLALNALRTLRVASDNDDGSISKPQELWDHLRIAAYKLILARPSMSAAVTSALVNALNAIRDKALQGAGDFHEAARRASLKEAVAQAISEQIEKRNQNSSRLVNTFVEYLRRLASKDGEFRILTLSSSSTLLACLERAVQELPELKITIIALESRPNMEGATFAVSFLNKLRASGHGNNVEIIIAPDSHVCTLAKRSNLLLLGADRVSADGHVSNKMGSLSATMAVKALAKANVAIVTETDKIARPGAIEEHVDEDNDSEEVYSKWPPNTVAMMNSLPKANVKLYNFYFEWIPSEYIDVYITENGVLGMDEIKQISEQKRKLEDELFDSRIKEAAAAG